MDDQLIIHEDFIGLVHVEQTDVKSLYIAFKYVHIRCHFGAVVVKGSMVPQTVKPDGSLTRFNNTGVVDMPKMCGAKCAMLKDRDFEEKF